MIRATAAGVLAAVAVAGCAAEPPRPLTAAQIPAAFIALTQAPDRTMHMEWTGTYSPGELDGRNLPFNAVLDFAGANYAGTTALPADRDKEDVLFPAPYTEIAVVDGQAYQRTSQDGFWQSAPLPSRTLDPFGGLGLGQIEYVGQEIHGGADVHHLRVTDASALESLFLAGPGGAISSRVRVDAGNSSFDFLVDANGRPLSATLELASTQDPNDFRGPSVSSTYRFTDWGKEIYIIPPPSPL